MPLHRLTGSLSTFGDPLVVCVDLIKYISSQWARNHQENMSEKKTIYHRHFLGDTVVEADLVTEVSFCWPLGEAKSY